MQGQSIGSYRRPYRRLSGALKVGAACTNGTRIVEIVALGSSAFAAVRMKATCAGTLSFHFLGPDTNAETGAFPTECATGNPTDVAVGANTEAIIQPAPNGEEYGLVIFTPSGSGVITYVDYASIG